MSRSRYNIAKCNLGKACKKCSSIADPIAVNRGTHYTLYCSSCGAYIIVKTVSHKQAQQ